MKRYFSRGKLLLTGEYSILRGAEALAVPTHAGQILEVFNDLAPCFLRWEAYDHENKLWFWAEFDADFQSIYTSNSKSAQLLSKLLKLAFADKELPVPNTLVKTKLEFNPKWGLGSSSTLVHLIAQWSGTQVYDIYFKNFHGSGYDIATALEENALLYKLEQPQKPLIKKVKLPELFKETHFVYLGKKQNSQAEVSKFKSKVVSDSALESISKLSKQLLTASTLQELEHTIVQHETITGLMLEQKPIKDRLFSQYHGAVKSLGAWGGDFIWATGKEAKTYFSKIGFDTIVPFEEMIFD